MLFYRFFFALFFISLIPLAINVYQLYQTQTTIEEKVNQELVSVAESIQDEVDSWVDTTLAISRMLVQTEQIQSGDVSEQEALLKSALDTLDWTYLSFATNSQGSSIARSDGKDPKDYSDRAYFTQIIAGQEIGQQVLISRTTGQPAMCMSIPITKSGRIQGALVQCASLEAVSETIASQKIGATGYVRLIDSSERLIAHGDPNEVREGLVELSGEVINGLGFTQSPLTVELSDKEVVTYSTETKLGWKVNVVQDYDEAYASLIAGKRNGVIAFVLILAIVLLVAYLLGNL